MNKEECLSLMQHLILQLRDNDKVLKEDPRLMQDWCAKQKHLDNSIKQLNSCDSDWLNVQYLAWFKKEIEPYIAKIDNTSRE